MPTLDEFLVRFWPILVEFRSKFGSNSLHMMEMVAACNQAQSPYDRGYPGPVIHNFAILSLQIVSS